MSRSRRRALTWALVALGIAMVALGGVLVATFPWSQAGAPFAHFWSQGQGLPHGVQPGYGPWYGYPHGWGFFHGPRLFGGGLFILVLVIGMTAQYLMRRRERRILG